MVRLVVTIAAIAVLAAGCSGDKKTTSRDATPAGTAAHVEPENFNDLVLTDANKSAEAGFSATYTIRATVDGKAVNGTVTWHRKGTNMRSDFVGTVDGQEIDLTVIAGPNYPAQSTGYVCGRVEQSCALRQLNGASPEDLASWPAFQTLDVARSIAGLNFYDEAARTLLEQPVLCFVGVTEAAPDAHGEVCLTDGGLPLLVTASTEGVTISLTATELPGGVSDADFELPFAVVGQ